MNYLGFLCACKTTRACCCNDFVEIICKHPFVSVLLCIVAIVLIIGMIYLISKSISYNSERKIFKLMYKK